MSEGNYMMTREHLMADLVTTFPGMLVRPGEAYGVPGREHGVWIGAEDVCAIGDMPVFQYISPDPDDYNGNVAHAFEAWLEARGYEVEHYDVGVFFAMPLQLPLAGGSDEEVRG